MKLTQSLSRMQQTALKWRSEGIKIALVPTMGFLHEGHLSLMRHARRSVGRKGKVITSIYVNPTQFGPGEDYGRYPRDIRADKTRCREMGVDMLFLPDNASMYPSSSSGLPYSCFVKEKRLTSGMEGASRPTHFEGVTTVVAKLFLITQPHYSVFGAKDFQQARVIEKMTSDLNFPIQIIIAPTLREADGLAMSSRNKYLSKPERLQAPALWNAIQSARDSVKNANNGFIPVNQLRKKLIKQITQSADMEVDYIEFFDSETLVPVKKVSTTARMAVAARLGAVRLIDNASLDPASPY